MSSDPSFKDMLKQLLSLTGFECGHHLTFSKWIAHGRDTGLAEINSIREFKVELKDGYYFLDLENVTVHGVEPSPFFVSYVGLNLSYKDGIWSGNMFTEEEELPHNHALSDLERRSKRMEEKLLGVVRLMTILILS